MITRLAPLALEGVGTQDVESLASYVCRLAAAHAVGAWQVRKLLMGHVGPGPCWGRVKETRFEALCASTQGAVNLVAALEALTGQSNLSCGTLTKLQHVLSRRCDGLFFPRRRWCPECYRDDEARPFEPLHWRLQFIQRCPTHLTCSLTSVTNATGLSLTSALELQN